MPSSDDGEGPGAEHAPLWCAWASAVALSLLTVVLLTAVVHWWPNCESSTCSVAESGSLKALAIVPSWGPTSGDYEVSLLGGGFADEVRVSFDGTPAASVRVQSPGVLRVKPPKHGAGRATVEVSTSSEKQPVFVTSGFVYADSAGTPPTINSLSPKGGPLRGGQRVTVTGKGFDAVASVTFGGVPAADVLVADDALLMATTPAHAEGPVDVVVSGRSSATLSSGYTFSCWAGLNNLFFLMVVLAGALGGTLHALRSLFWYTGNRDLRVSWLPMYFVLPINGAAVAAIFYLVFLAGLFTVEGTSTYLFIGIAGLVGMFSSQAAAKLKKIAEALLTEVPPGANPSMHSSGGAPSGPVQVTSVNPQAGPLAGGTMLTIKGAGFSTLPANSLDVKLGGVPANNVKVVDDTTITAESPQGAAHGAVDVAVGNVSLANGFTYT